MQLSACTLWLLGLLCFLSHPQLSITPHPGCNTVLGTHPSIFLSSQHTRLLLPWSRRFASSGPHHVFPRQPPSRLRILGAHRHHCQLTSHGSCVQSAGPFPNLHLVPVVPFCPINRQILQLPVSLFLCREKLLGTLHSTILKGLDLEVGVGRGLPASKNCQHEQLSRYS